VLAVPGVVELYRIVVCIALALVCCCEGEVVRYAIVLCCAVQSRLWLLMAVGFYDSNRRCRAWFISRRLQQGTLLR